MESLSFSFDTPHYTEEKRKGKGRNGKIQISSYYSYLGLKDSSIWYLQRFFRRLSTAPVNRQKSTGSRF